MANIADTPSPIEEDTLALYNAVSKGNGTSMVQAYSQAARSAIVASSIKRQTAPFVWTGDRHHARSPGSAGTLSYCTIGIWRFLKVMHLSN